MIDREQLEWLQVLINAYRREHDWEHDEDPRATEEMLLECGHIYNMLSMRLPPEPPEDVPPVDFDPDTIPF